MDLKALILIGGSSPNGGASEPGTMGGVPFAGLDVLGASVLERLAQRLRAAGISELSLIGTADQNARTHMERAIYKARADAVWATGDSFWQSAEDAFEQFRQNGADLVLILQRWTLCGVGL